MLNRIKALEIAVEGLRRDMDIIADTFEEIIKLLDIQKKNQSNTWTLVKEQMVHNNNTIVQYTYKINSILEEAGLIEKNMIN